MAKTRNKLNSKKKSDKQSLSGKKIRIKKKIAIKERKKQKRQKLLQDIFLTLMIFVGLIGLIYVSTMQIVQVTGYDMTPTINDADRLFVLKHSEIRRFSLVSFKVKDDQRFVERVIGLPGEEVYFKDGTLFVNNQEIAERFLSTTFSDYTDKPLTENFHVASIAGTVKIPEDCYLVLGDNREHATDSRYFGVINKKDISGVVKARIFPIDSMQKF